MDRRRGGASWEAAAAATDRAGAPQQHPQLQPQLLQLVDRLLQRLHIVLILVVPGDVILLVPVAELIQVLTLGQPVPLGDRFLRHRNST